MQMASTVLLLVVVCLDLVSTVQSTPTTSPLIAPSNGTIGPYNCSTSGFVLNQTSLSPDSTQWHIVSQSACGAKYHPGLQSTNLVLTLMDDDNTMDAMIVDTSSYVWWGAENQQCWTAYEGEAFSGYAGDTFFLYIKCNNVTAAKQPCNIAYYVSWDCFTSDSNNNDNDNNGNNGGERRASFMGIAVLAAASLLLML